MYRPCSDELPASVPRGETGAASEKRIPTYQAPKRSNSVLEPSTVLRHR